MYTQDDLVILDDPLAFIRKYPQMFLPRVCGRSLAVNLADGALLLSDAPVTVARAGDWWIVAAEADWMGVSGEDAFTRMSPFPEAGPNSVRPEVLLTAFATHVATWGAPGARVIKGEIHPDSEIRQLAASHPLWKRVVAFRMGEEAVR
jgi:hypothetical protein